MINVIDKTEGVQGTLVNRKLFMGLQGFSPCSTYFNADGSIVQQFTGQGTLTTTFPSSSQVIERFVGTDGKIITKTTTFYSTSIGEVISE